MKTVNVFIIIALMASLLYAVQPNFERTTTFDVDGIEGGAGNDMVTTVYTDGLGRGLQQKLQLPGTSPQEDRVVLSNFFDESGRPRFSSKSFVDHLRPGEYLPGEITDNNTIDNDFEQQLYNQHNDHHAFSRIWYRDDPSGVVKYSTGPGDTSIHGLESSWIFGVSPLKDTLFQVANAGTVTFVQGLITAITFQPGKLPDVLEGLYNDFLANNPFTNPDHMLSVAMSPDGKISEELKDVFGRTIKTFSAPDTNGTPGSKIASGAVYDLLGNVLKELPPSKNGGKLIDDVEYRYNTIGQLVWKKTPDGGEYTYEYMDNGSLKKMISMYNGEYEWGLQYFYDELGRLTRIDENLFPNTTNYGVIKNYYDDTAGLPSEIKSIIPPYVRDRLTNLKGRLVATLTSNLGVKAIDVGELFSYDDEGRICRTYLVIEGSPLYQETVFAYDIHGKVLTEDFYYSGDHIRKRYEYDKLGRLSKVYHGIPQQDGTYQEKELVEHAYKETGLPDRKKLTGISGGAHEVSFGYDLQDRIKTSVVDPALKGFSQTINYDGRSGNVTNTVCTYIPDPLNGTATAVFNSHFVYDDVNRLTRDTISNSGTTVACAYEYDQAGRFIGKKEGQNVIDDYTYYADSTPGALHYTNRLKSTSKNISGTAGYVYDRRGNLVVDFLKNMVIQYDWRNLPLTFRFYDDLSDAGITRDATGTCTTAYLYKHMNDKVTLGAVNLTSTVMMVYDAGGNRVCKMDVK